MYYAGIGSRETPPFVLARMHQLAVALANHEYTLRSGGADGADSAFEAGCREAGGDLDLWLPWEAFNGRTVGSLPAQGHYQMGAHVHPRWHRLRPKVQALHARNTGQVLGEDLDTPVSFVVCWTADGCETEAQRTADTGGTGTAIVLACRRGIPVFNLANPGTMARLSKHVLADLRKFYHPGSKQPESVQVGFADPAGSDLDCIIPLDNGQLTSERVNSFIQVAREFKDATYQVNPGTTGQDIGQVAELFALAPTNVILPSAWRPWLGKRQPVALADDGIYQQTRVVHVKEAPFDTYIGRTCDRFSASPWANPFKIGPDGSREEVIERYHQHIMESPELLQRIPELRGRTLGCWCKSADAPHTLCHGDVLAALADGRPWTAPSPVQGSLF